MEPIGRIRRFRVSGLGFRVCQIIFGEQKRDPHFEKSACTDDCYGQTLPVTCVRKSKPIIPKP